MSGANRKTTSISIESTGGFLRFPGLTVVNYKGVECNKRKQFYIALKKKNRLKIKNLNYPNEKR